MKLIDVYQNAIKNKFAIGAYNFYNMETLQAITEASKITNSPLIVSVSESAIKYMSMEMLKSMVDAVKRNKEAQIFLHLDHGKTFEICKLCIDNDFDSVMIDGSSLPYEENIAITKKVVDYAHTKGVQVEGELGTLAGIEDDINVEKTTYTNPLEAKDFVEKTNVDSLAIAIGTSHGAYKFNGDPKIRIDILEEIEKMLPNFPLVLHGASSVPQEITDKFNKFGGDITSAKGVSEEILREVSKHNIVKINVDTDIRLAFTTEIRKAFIEDKKMFSPRDYLSLSKNAVTNLVASKQKIFGN